MFPQRIEQEVVAREVDGSVIAGPWITGRARDEGPYAAFAPGNLTKRELAVKLSEYRGPTSEKWIERRMRFDGLPYHKPDPGRRQSPVRFAWPRVQAWLATYGHQVGGA